VGTITSDGAVRPGGSNLNTGTLHSGNVRLDVLSVLGVRFNGTTPGSGYDQLVVNGSVDLTGRPTLDITPLANLMAMNGDTFTIITATGGITGTFDTTPETTLFFSNGQLYRLNYTANSVVVTRAIFATATTLSSTADQPVFSQQIPYVVTVNTVPGGMIVPVGT